MRFKNRLIMGLLLSAAALMLSGCVRDMDPFEGGDGVRVNINGQKCVMLGIPGHDYADLNMSGDVSSFQAIVSMMVGIMSADLFELSFNIKENDAFIKEQKYTIKPSGDKTVTLSLPARNGEGVKDINLSGWLYFISFGEIIEARFDLDGKGSDGMEYSLRHGFLRLHQGEVYQ